MSAVLQYNQCDLVGKYEFGEDYKKSFQGIGYTMEHCKDKDKLIGFRRAILRP